MPVRILTISTSTGVFPSTGGGYVDFGDLYRFASYADSSITADRDILATLEGNIGASPKWTTVITLTTNSTATRFDSTGDVSFDKLRVNVSTNNSTESFQAWLGAGN